MPKLSEPEYLPPSAFVALQYLLPHHLLSRFVWAATRWQTPAWKNLLIRNFLRHYPVDMREAAQPDAFAYADFNAFFTRALAPHARAADTAPGTIISPVDGRVSEAGAIEGERLLQAKGRHYTVTELLGDGSLAARFRTGAFATLYLAPHDYHRIHMPVTGRLVATHYIPGRLFSVNQATTLRVPRLFARNDRVVCVFEGAAGRFAVVLVGALFVGSISTVWAGDITPAGRRRGGQLPPPASEVHLLKGAELGRFNMGSTVILLFEPNRVRWSETLARGAALRMGAAIGHARM